MSIIDYFTQIVGQPPENLEFLPYIFSCLFLFLVCKYIISFITYIFTIIYRNF